MQFIPALPTYQDDFAAQSVWEKLKAHFNDDDGIAYYRHPNLGSGTGVSPDIVVLARRFGCLAVRIVPLHLNDIDAITPDIWNFRGASMESPLLDLDDFILSLNYRFNQERALRNKVLVRPVIALTNISKADFENKFGELDQEFIIWQDAASTHLPAARAPMSELDWKLAKSVFQSASALTKHNTVTTETSDRLGQAIRILERDIALLDDQQSKVAIQIPPGPQRIRGLAGTGKTVLLAMKAANIHSHYPDKRILFTFNTQSLYNAVRELITKFYRVNKQADPDWSVVHVRHGWGGSSKHGVYSDLCARQGAPHLTYQNAKSIDRENPFRACCRDALGRHIEEYYDYILLDEAQDFSREFFQVLYRLARQPKCIYFAFDELQSLSSVEIPTSKDIFGTDERGQPLVDLDGEYPGPMDKDLVLFKAYRCPHKILMVAHGIGLGIHNPRGCVQMITNIPTWEAVGYEVVKGPLEKDADVVIKRPSANSPNRAEQIYTGNQPPVAVNSFATRDEELQWVANSIYNDIFNEGVAPEHIIVISLDSLPAKKYMAKLQSLLSAQNVASVVPGLIDGSDEFAEPGRVTLSTIYRAKGNEAPIVYIISFETLYDYVAEVELRNKAFTSISRSKGWVRITGVGDRMKQAINEIGNIYQDIPEFKFKFPDPQKLQRNLDAAETTRRRKEVKIAKSAVRDLAQMDVGALAEVDAETLAVLAEKLKRLKEARGESK
ncbi:MAG: DEAD/DEAH box helicase [Phycisphaerae bacterium]